MSDSLTGWNLSSIERTTGSVPAGGWVTGAAGCAGAWGAWSAGTSVPATATWAEAGRTPSAETARTLISVRTYTPAGVGTTKLLIVLRSVGPGSAPAPPVQTFAASRRPAATGAPAGR